MQLTLDLKDGRRFSLSKAGIQVLAKDFYFNRTFAESEEYWFDPSRPSPSMDGKYFHGRVYLVFEYAGWPEYYEPDEEREPNERFQGEDFLNKEELEELPTIEELAQYLGRNFREWPQKGIRYDLSSITKTPNFISEDVEETWIYSPLTLEEALRFDQELNNLMR